MKMFSWLFAFLVLSAVPAFSQTPAPHPPVTTPAPSVATEQPEVTQDIAEDENAKNSQAKDKMDLESCCLELKAQMRDNQWKQSKIVFETQPLEERLNTLRAAQKDLADTLKKQAAEALKKAGLAPNRYHVNFDKMIFEKNSGPQPHQNQPAAVAPH